MSSHRIEPAADIVAYYRTSTDDQKLGIKAQRQRVEEIARSKQVRVISSYTEHESGGDRSRPELRKALSRARGSKAILCVAKLDRLARDSGFLQSLRDGDVPIIFGDMPEVDGSAASGLMVQMMAGFAEFERKRIGERTKEALAQLKKDGMRLGTVANLTAEGRKKGSKKGGQKLRKRAIDAMEAQAQIALEKRDQGWTLRKIADHFNELVGEGDERTPREVTRNGKSFSPTQVKRILDRITRKVKGHA